MLHATWRTRSASTACTSTCASFQEIADANDRSRAEGTSGYDASVDYVAQTLREKGFDVQTPEYEHLGVARPGNPTLAVSGRRYPVDQAVATDADRGLAGCAPSRCGPRSLPAVPPPTTERRR